jgi:uncharacterized ferritin-like protein (DUF455 family)
MHDDSRSAALAVLQETDPERKCAATAQLSARIALADQTLGTQQLAVQSLPIPGRPAHPELVAPRLLAQRKLGTPEGRAVLLHAVAHIEFNAINLAWDAVYRFGNLPAAYYRDWASVAADEARHFQLICARLRELGFEYGDFPAHDGLWQMAVATEDALHVRMALVPRLLEARGLDVTPGMIEKLRHVGDLASIAVLQVILSEEVRHVEIGSTWFRFACAQMGIVDHEAEFLHLLKTRATGRVKPPFNVPARLLAGFSALELAELERC